MLQAPLPSIRVKRWPSLLLAVSALVATLALCIAVAEVLGLGPEAGFKSGRLAGFCGLGAAFCAGLGSHCWLKRQRWLGAGLLITSVLAMLVTPALLVAGRLRSTPPALPSGVAADLQATSMTNGRRLIHPVLGFEFVVPERFASNGQLAASLSSIARQAGLSAGAYYAFQSALGESVLVVVSEPIRARGFPDLVEGLVREVQEQPQLHLESSTLTGTGDTSEHRYRASVSGAPRLRGRSVLLPLDDDWFVPVSLTVTSDTEGDAIVASLRR